ncbi:Hypothetical protein, predicted lipoprotein [Metamycoplasma alkalescens 14918]|uniref:Lipoprotein n=1 Tax=Metamycoplasma alkalescens 14918 TaxID=1188234 RepID=N9SRB7_9BACT|nr:hypothetical protein [Metamycoplasma alkalescens]ENY53904.1 Hypothetical protein, predicted lipoprotein [Metamycoplasma alkalescens 14918]
MKKAIKWMFVSSPILIAAPAIVSCAPINKTVTTLKNKVIWQVEQEIDDFFKDKTEDKDTEKLKEDVKKLLKDLKSKEISKNYSIANFLANSKDEFISLVNNFWKLKIGKAKKVFEYFAVYDDFRNWLLKNNIDDPINKDVKEKVNKFIEENFDDGKIDFNNFSLDDIDKHKDKLNKFVEEVKSEIKDPKLNELVSNASSKLKEILK